MTPEQLSAKLQSNKGKLVRSLQNALYAGVAAFQKGIIQDYYSNRPGLKRQSGTLARGWRLNAWGWGEGVDFTVKLENSEKYGPIHEYGHPGYWVYPKNKPFLAWKAKTEYITSSGKKCSKSNWVFTKKPVFIRMPKRTDVMGNWKNYGINRVKVSLHVALSKGLSEI